MTLLKGWCVSTAVALVCKYVSKGWTAVQGAYADGEKEEDLMKVFVYLEAVEKLRHSSEELQAVRLIEEHKLEREHVPTKHLKSREVGERDTHTHSNEFR